MAHAAILRSRGFVSLDLLRGVAAWSVAAPHFFLFAGSRSSALEFATLFAVEVFFVLSGFVLGPQLDRCFERPQFHTVSTFFLRRWLRTLPIFFVVLVLLAALNGVLSTGRFLEYATFTTTWLSIPEANEFFVPAWSLAVEEWFYLIFPPFLMAFALMRVDRRLAIAAFVGLLLVVKYLYVWGDVSGQEQLRRVTAVRLDAIVLGYAAYLATKGRREISNIALFVLWGTALLGGAATYVAFIKADTIAFVYAAAVAGTGVVAGARYSDRLLAGDGAFAAAVARVSAFLAHTSYTTYLCHLLVFQIVFRSELMAPSLNFFVYVTGVIAFTVVAFYAVEQPFLKARPTYEARHGRESGERPFLNSFPARLATNALVCIGILVTVELGSRMLSELYQSLHVERAVAAATSGQAGPTAEATVRDSVEQQVQKDLVSLRNLEGSPYRYASYSVYENRPFTSATINIGAEGERQVPSPATPATGRAYVVWVFGASPVFGATNADAWTIPARLQRHLSERLGRTVVVRNLGVVGYTSWQALVAFQKALMHDKPPDAVVAFLTNVDHALAWDRPDAQCRHLTYTGVGSYSILDRAWERLSRGQYVFADDIFNNMKRSFPGFMELVRLFWKAEEVLAARLDPEAAKLRYREKRDQFVRDAMACWERQARSFRTNVGLMADLAKNHDATFFIGTLPELSSTKKTLVRHELLEKYAKENYFFALTDQELAQTPFLPNTRLSQTHYADKKLFHNTLEELEQILVETVHREGVEYLNLQTATDRLGPDIELFSTAIHFTHEGADLISRLIADQMTPVIYKDRREPRTATGP